MKKILCNLTVLAVLIAASLTTAYAQQGQSQKAIVPGEKGALPKVTPPAKADGNLFTGLWISEVDQSIDLFGGKSIHTNLSWPDAYSFEADSYTLQIQEGGTWKDYENFEGGTVGTSVDVSTATRFRLKINGGDMNGWLSNEVTAIVPTMISEWRSSSISNADAQPLVIGVEYGTSLSLNVESNVSKDGNATEETVTYTVADGVYRYSWYRRNPNTWEMTAIEGANKKTYTATLDDVGYQLVLMVTGDNTHCGFTKPIVMGSDYNVDETIVSIPVGFGFEYMGGDGFVLNTDYVMPEGCSFYINAYEMYDWVKKAIPTNQVTVRKPGQYEVRVSSDEYENAEVGVDIAGVKLTNPVEMPNIDPETGEIVEGTYFFFPAAQAIPYMYQQPLTVKVENGANPVVTIVDLIGQNLDGEWVTMASQKTDNNGEATLLACLADYYVRARGTDDTDDTYYPGVKSIDEATTVRPGQDEEYNPVAVSMSMIEAEKPYIEERIYIEPGCDGELPALPVFEKKDGFFGGFGLRRVYFSSYDKIWIVEFEIPWRNIAERGDGTVSVQCRASEDDAWSSPSVYATSGGVDTEVRLGNATKMSYRLVVTGGPMNGWVSNTVSATRPKSQIEPRGFYSQPLFIGVNYTVDAQNIQSAYLYTNGNKKELSYNDLTRNYKWYRRNPETGEATLIEGATKSTYVPTMADAGYELISVVTGDPNGYDYFTSYNQGIVQLPILCYVAYAGDDGILLNTNYVLPDAEKNLWRNTEGWGSWEGDEDYSQGHFDEGVVKTVKPGQYAIKIKAEDLFFQQIGYGDEPYMLCRRGIHWWSYRQFFVSEAELYPIPLPFVVKKDGACMKDVSIDVIGNNIEGELVVLKTFSPEAGKDTTTVEMIQGFYYIRSQQTDASAATYYPNVVKQADATLFFVNDAALEGTSEDFAFVIEAQEGGSIQGDFNGDNKVNGTDIQAVINLIVDEDYHEEADVNHDGKVNGTDIQCIINIIVEEE
jgi:hypothetical protein